MELTLLQYAAHRDLLKVAKEHLQYGLGLYDLAVAVERVEKADKERLNAIETQANTANE